MSKIYYCAFESIFDPVFDSQVLGFLRELSNKVKKEKMPLSLIIFGSINDIFKKDYRKKRKDISKYLIGRVFFSFKYPYLYKLHPLLNLSILLNVINAILFIRFIVGLRKNEKAVFHCRTEIASYILLKSRSIYFKNIKVICDSRGIGSKEILYKYSGRKAKRISKKIEKIESFAQKNSDYIFCVSNTFKNYIIENNKEKKLRIDVVPCCINIKRFNYDPLIRKKKRDELDIDNNFVVLYSGSLNEWQLPFEMINIFKIFEKIISNSIFLIYTRDIDQAKEILSVSGMPGKKYILKNISFDLITDYLQVGDIGLLIREDNDVNRVASPIKFSEYTRSGVPVLSSIKSDIKKYIKKYDLGLNIDDHNNKREIEKTVIDIKSNIDVLISDDYRNRISGIIGREMAWGNYIDSIIKVYSKLGS